METLNTDSMRGRLHFCFTFRLVLLLFVLLVLYHGRQVEIASSLDFLWKQQAKKELEEMSEMRRHTNQLLQNILPLHVAKYFLEQDRQAEVSNIFYEKLRIVVFYLCIYYICFYCIFCGFCCLFASNLYSLRWNEKKVIGFVKSRPSNCPLIKFPTIGKHRLRKCMHSIASFVISHAYIHIS